MVEGQIMITLSSNAENLSDFEIDPDNHFSNADTEMSTEKPAKTTEIDVKVWIQLLWEIPIQSSIL